MRLILASASPARLSTLQRAGLSPEVIVSEVDESRFTADTPAKLAEHLAREKAESVFAALGSPPDCIVIGCDSVLDFEGRPEGKPGTPAAAKALLKRTRGRSGTLVTGHHVIVSKMVRDKADSPRITRANRVGTTIVHVADLTDEEIDAYVATGEPIEVAGGFTIDGLGGAFITGIEGDPHNVVGVSLPLLRVMLTDAGVNWPSLWAL